jgi:hypothetical protein
MLQETVDTRRCFPAVRACFSLFVIPAARARRGDKEAGTEREEVAVGCLAGKRMSGITILRLHNGFLHGPERSGARSIIMMPMLRLH